MGSSTPPRTRRIPHHGRRVRRFGALAATLVVVALGLSACVPPAEPGAPFLLKGTWVGGLSRPWDLTFLPDGTPVYTENDSGQISARLSDTDTHHVLASVSQFEPSFSSAGEGGLMGIAADPDWWTNQLVYVCYSTGTDNRVARMTLNPAADPPVANWKDIVTGIPHNTFHNGCRVRFEPGTGALFVSTGDAGQATAPQDDNSLGGKILRIDRDGNAWPGNPNGFKWYTKGHRNPQGIAFRPGTQQVFDDEHGPDVNDEVNLLTPDGNAGWNPNVNGVYTQTPASLVPMTDPSVIATFGGILINPTWESGSQTVAPSGSTFLSGAQWKNWDGALVVACLDSSAQVGQRLLVFHLSVDGKSTAPPVTAFNLGIRLRAAVQGPDGALYVITDGDAGTGEIWRVVPL